MTELTENLAKRSFTDRKLSFGLYVILLIILIAVSAVAGVIIRIITVFTIGSVHIYSMIISMVVAIAIWWYNWILYKRRNEHFDRIKTLKGDLIVFLKEKFGSEIGELQNEDTLLMEREKHRSTTLFLAWLICTYLNFLTPLHSVFHIFTVLSFVLTLIVCYYLTVDFYYHEQGEITFFNKASKIFQKNNISFNPDVSRPLKRRRYGLYIFLTIITLGIYSIYWAYVIFHDPNKHFDTHDSWENQLKEIVKNA